MNLDQTIGKLQELGFVRTYSHTRANKEQFQVFSNLSNGAVVSVDEHTPNNVNDWHLIVNYKADSSQYKKIRDIACDLGVCSTWYPFDESKSEDVFGMSFYDIYPKTLPSFYEQLINIVCLLPQWEIQPHLWLLDYEEGKVLADSSDKISLNRIPSTIISRL